MGRTNEFTLVADADFTGKAGYAVKVKNELVNRTPVGTIATAGGAIDGIVTDITAGSPQVLAVAKVGDIVFACIGTGGVTVGDELVVGADGRLVEAVDIINDAREYENAKEKVVSKKDFKSIKDKAERKVAKKLYKEARVFNEEIAVSKLVCEELNKFSSPLYKAQINAVEPVLNGGLEGLFNADINAINAELANAKAMPKTSAEEKELREFLVELAQKKKDSFNTIKKHFPTMESFVEPDYELLNEYFNKEDECNAILKDLYQKQKDAKKAKDNALVKELKAEIKKVELEKKVAQADAKAEMDKHARFNRAAKPYIDAKKLMTQKENYTHLDDIMALYDDAKVRYEAKIANDKEEALRKQKEKDEMTAKLKAEKAAQKAAKKK